MVNYVCFSQCQHAGEIEQQIKFQCPSILKLQFTPCCFNNKNCFNNLFLPDSMVSKWIKIPWNCTWEIQICKFKVSGSYHCHLSLTRIWSVISNLLYNLIKLRNGKVEFWHLHINVCMTNILNHVRTDSDTFKSTCNLAWL